MLRQSNTLYAFEHERFEEVSGLSLILQEPAPDPANPILAAAAPGAPDDGKLCYPGTVAPWGDGYGMWYQAEDRQHRLTRCFAYSADGLHWERRGVVDGDDFHDIGNSFNVWDDGEQFLAPVTALATLRPHQIPDPRRRQLAEEQMASGGRDGITCFIGLATSPDGLRWTVPERAPAIPMKLEAPRLYRFQGRYIMNTQTNGVWFDPPHPAGRVVVFFHSDDLRTWEMHPACMTNRAHESLGGQTHIGIVPIKCIDDRLLIGLGGRFDDAEELTDQHWDITLLYSYDGLTWRPVAPAHERRSWLRRGRQGEWDFGGVVGMGLIEHGDLAAVYYNGTTIGNCSHSFPLYDPGPCAVGRASFPRDRFAALQPTVGWKAYALPERAHTVQGVVTTKPIVLSADRPLALNIELPSPGGQAAVEVEILTPDGTVYDSACVQQGGIAVPVPLSKPVLDRPVQVRISLTGGSAPDRVPVLYAVYY
jgi:hypothetical protein